MSETLVLIVLSGITCMIVGVWGLHQLRRVGVWFKNLFAPRGVTFGLADVPLSAYEWQRFAAFATAKGIQQKTLLAECVKFYLQEKVK